jgi:D-arabinose 1-dehydrogenase-like Zn-dependent alcohol dehydrogenase
MVLHTPGQPLQLEQRPIPTPGSGQLLIKVLACGVCRTDLHLVDGELPQAQLPRVPGHEIVGEVTAVGATVGADWIGRRVGGAVARLDLRRVRLLSIGPGKPLRSGAVHRLQSGRRLR